jgi:hypothetical protein
MTWHCPYCGSELLPVDKDNPDWGSFTSDYAEAHGTEWFLCSKEGCVFHDMPLVLCHPVKGWNYPAGDSFAIAYVK